MIARKVIEVQESGVVAPQMIADGEAPERFAFVAHRGRE
jgi:hypothetical protein